MNSDLERFKETFDCSDPNACWVRKGSELTAWEYDNFTIAGFNMGAHRAAWTLFRGEIPDGMHVLHECERGPCANPTHLFLGTQSDNQQHWVRKGKRKRLQEAMTSRNVHTTAISFTPQILKLGRLRAKSLRQSFSGYLETLVKQDIGEKRAKVTQAA